MAGHLPEARGGKRMCATSLTVPFCLLLTCNITYLLSNIICSARRQSSLHFRTRQSRSLGSCSTLGVHQRHFHVFVSVSIIWVNQKHFVAGITSKHKIRPRKQHRHGSTIAPSDTTITNMTTNPSVQIRSPRFLCNRFGLYHYLFSDHCGTKRGTSIKH